MGLFRNKKNRTVPAVPTLRDRCPDLSENTIRIIEKSAPFTMTSPERVAALCEAVQYVSRSKLPGAIVECGVWQGGSVLAAIEMLRQSNDFDREVWLYDTFEGMTPPDSRDVDFLGRDAGELLREADRSDSKSIWCCSHLEQVRKRVYSTGYPQDKFQFVVGPVESTLPASLPAQIALLRLDTDWYESTKHELTHLLPRLVPGGVLIIDDYGHWEGCRRAVDEFFDTWRVPMLLNRIDYTGRIGVLCQPFSQCAEPGEYQREACHAKR